MKVEVNVLFLIETMRFSFGLMMKCTNIHMISLRDFSSVGEYPIVLKSDVTCMGLCIQTYVE